MAIIKTEEKEVQAEDHSPIKEACEELGVPFGCRNGVCGTCMITVTEGEENLSELTEEEMDMYRDREHRLACQANIKGGTVQIEFDDE